MDDGKYSRGKCSLKVWVKNQERAPVVVKKRERGLRGLIEDVQRQGISKKNAIDNLKRKARQIEGSSAYEGDSLEEIYEQVGMPSANRKEDHKHDSIRSTSLDSARD